MVSGVYEFLRSGPEGWFRPTDQNQGRRTLVITAYLSIGSTYTYLTALRLRSVIESQDAAFDFKPFSVRAIMREMNNIPFPPEKKAKEQDFKAEKNQMF